MARASATVVGGILEARHKRQAAAWIYPVSVSLPQSIFRSAARGSTDGINA